MLARIWIFLSWSMLCTGSCEGQEAGEWSSYGGGLSAQHFSPRTQISRNNVNRLEVAWTFHTGALGEAGATNSRSNFEANPVLWSDALYFDTPYNVVFAVSANQGKEIWKFDPKVSHQIPFGIVASRGVALWHGALQSKLHCAAHRVFVATLDARLIAIDATDGRVCEGFGVQGSVDLTTGVIAHRSAWYSFTSPPTVVGDVIVVGSSVADNQMIGAPSGVIRGFDARSGAMIWRFEPLRGDDAGHPRSGAANAWSVIAADPSLGLVYVPTGSPSLDFYGVNRPGANRDANSVVALEAATGRRVWGYQVVHHDLWDFDVAAEPLLFMFRGRTPAIAVATKMGMVFVLDRASGQPLLSVKERPVPQSTIPGEATAATQPIPSTPSLTTTAMTSTDFSDMPEADAIYCRKRLAGLKNKGLYTPVGLEPTLLYPGSSGGVNWGSPALDPQSSVLYANVSQLAYEVRLVPREPSMTSAAKELWDNTVSYWNALLGHTPIPPSLAFWPPDSRGFELSEQTGAPYRIFRTPLTSPNGLPCAPMPWGALVALDMNEGRIIWKKPLGTLIAGRATGSPTLGGPIVTAGGLVFTGGGSESKLRAFDAASGNEIWSGRLPAEAQATPMSYESKGRQYVVIAAGGHMSLAPQLGDSLVAFALAERTTP